MFFTFLHFLLSRTRIFRKTATLFVNNILDHQSIKTLVVDPYAGENKLKPMVFHFLGWAGLAKPSQAKQSLFAVCRLLFVVDVPSECEHECKNTYDNEQKRIRKLI